MPAYSHSHSHMPAYSHSHALVLPRSLTRSLPRSLAPSFRLSLHHPPLPSLCFASFAFSLAPSLASPSLSLPLPSYSLPSPLSPSLPLSRPLSLPRFLSLSLPITRPPPSLMLSLSLPFLSVTQATGFTTSEQHSTTMGFQTRE